MVGTFPDTWQETCLVVIQKVNDTAYLFSAATEDVEIGEPDYPFETIPTLAGGRLPKQSPQEDGELTLKLYPTDVSVAANSGLFQQFVGGTVDSSQPISTATSLGVGTSRNRDLFMVLVMWTDDSTIDTAAEVLDPSGATGTDKVAVRFYVKNARIVSHKTSFADKVLVTEVTFKYPAVNRAGTTQCFAWDSTNDAGGVTTLAAITYTSAL